MEHSQIILETLQKENISAYKLAKETGISESLFSKWKKHPTSEISSSNLERIASYLGYSVEHLLGQEEESERVSGFLPERLQEAMGDMSCEDFAKKFDGNANVISLYLQGQRKPSKVTLHLMAIYLGVNPEWLYGLDVPKHKKLAPTDGDELTEDKKYLIGAVRSMSDDDVRKLRLIVEEVILSRGQ